MARSGSRAKPRSSDATAGASPLGTGPVVVNGFLKGSGGFLGDLTLNGFCAPGEGGSFVEGGARIEAIGAPSALKQEHGVTSVNELFVRLARPAETERQG